MERLDKILSRIEGTVILICYSSLIVLVGLETVRRMITGSQAIWGPEVALYAFIWLSWFAMAEHVWRGTHLSFGLLRQRLDARIRFALESLDCLLWVIIGLIIINGSIEVVTTNISMGQTVFGTSLPLAAVSLAVPVGWLVTMVRVAQRFYFLVHAGLVMPSHTSPPFTLSNPRHEQTK